MLRVESPQIINGQQTTRTLHDSKSEKASLLVKVIKIPRKKGDDDHYHDLINNVVRATNWQNAITPIDLLSNDHKQVLLERELRKYKYQYLRKRQSKAESKLLYGQGYIPIKKEEIAQAVVACEFDPAIVFKGTKVLFDDGYYRNIFKSNSMSFYLSRYWLMLNVVLATRGFSQYAYAKWLVLNFIWNELESSISNNVGERKFRAANEGKRRAVLDLLRALIELVFKLSLQFHKNNSGKGVQAIDRQTFFKQSGLDKKFRAFWNSNGNASAKTFQTKLLRFKKELEKIDI